MLRVLSLAILIALTVAIVGSIAVAALSVFFWTEDAGASSAVVVAAMGLRFKKSLRLDQLGRSNVSAPGISYPVFSRWPADRSAPTLQSAPLLGRASRAETSAIAGSAANPGRVLPKLGIVAAFVVGGYLGAHFNTPSVAPTQPSPFPPPHASTPYISLQHVDLSEPPARAPLMAQPLAPIPMEVAEPDAASPPPSTKGPPLSSDEVLEAQAWLRAFGFDPGPLDGMRGPQTVAAVKRYQAARQKEETGLLDRPLLRQVRQEAGHSSR